MAKAAEDLEVVVPKGADGELEKKIIIEEIQKEYKKGDVWLKFSNNHFSS